MAATVKGGSPAAKKRAAITAGRPEPELRRFSTETDSAVELEKRVPFFEVDDEVYTILDNPDPSIGADALDMMAKDTPGAMAKAERFVMTAMLGDDGWDALRKLARDRVITSAQYRAMIKEVREKAMGPLEDDTPNR